MKEIADTGLIVALQFRNDQFHRWALEAFRRWAPFLTCEAVLTEAASFRRRFSRFGVETLQARKTMAGS